MADPHTIVSNEFYALSSYLGQRFGMTPELLKHLRGMEQAIHHEISKLEKGINEASR